MPTICFSICFCPSSPNIRICRLKRSLFIRCESVFPLRRTKPRAGWDELLFSVSENVHLNHTLCLREFVLPQNGVNGLLAPHHRRERFAAQLPFRVLRELGNPCNVAWREPNVI